jgi:hypothetical protein
LQAGVAAYVRLSFELIPAYVLRKTIVQWSVIDARLSR